MKTSLKPQENRGTGWRAALVFAVSLASCTHINPVVLKRIPGSQVIRAELDVKPEADSVRFFVVGDAGARAAGGGVRESSRAVAYQVERVCARQGGCDFGLMLGDNVYQVGIRDATDEAFFASFLRLYRASPQRPLYFTLGNHDYDPIIAKSERAQAELSLIARHLPDGARGRAQFYDFRAGPVFLAAWDTNAIVRICELPFGPADCGIEAVSELGSLGRSKLPFRVWFGHHPYRSNGAHGNAGEFLDEGLRLWDGEGLKRLLERYVVDQADLMLSGHDHNLQVFVGDGLGRTAALVSGAGSKTTSLRPASQRQASEFECDDSFGFVMVNASSQALSVEVYAVPTSDADPKRRCSTISDEPRYRLCKSVLGSWSSC